MLFNFFIHLIQFIDGELTIYINYKASAALFLCDQMLCYIFLVLLEIFSCNQIILKTNTYSPPFFLSLTWQNNNFTIIFFKFYLFIFYWFISINLLVFTLFFFSRSICVVCIRLSFASSSSLLGFYLAFHNLNIQPSRILMFASCWFKSYAHTDR